MNIRDAMLQEFDWETGLTRSVLAVVPDSLMDFEAAEGMRSIRWNVSHLVDIPTWLGMILCEAQFDVAPVGQPPHDTPLMESTEQAVSTFDRHIQEAKQVIETFDVESLNDSWSLLVGGEAVLTQPRHLVYRMYACNHVAHHRGHLLAYLRINSVETPRLYG